MAGAGAVSGAGAGAGSVSETESASIFQVESEEDEDVGLEFATARAKHGTWALYVHAFTSSFLADFSDVARLYFLIRLDSSAAFLVTVDLVVKATWAVAVPVGFLLDRTTRRHELVLRLGILIAATAWSVLAFVPEIGATTAVLSLAAAELGIVAWTVATDTLRVKSRSRLSKWIDAASLQIKCTAFSASGIAFALGFGGAATHLFEKYPHQVFAINAVALWVALLLTPSVPRPDFASAFWLELKPGFGETVRSILRKTGPWILYANAVAAVPSTVVPAMYFLTQTSADFGPISLGVLGSSTQLAAALTGFFIEKRTEPGIVVVAAIVNVAAACALATLPSESVVPIWVRAASLTVSASAQVALVTPCFRKLAGEFSETMETRASVVVSVQTLTGIGSLIGGAAAILMCREFGISAGNFSGMRRIVEVSATISTILIALIPRS